MGHHAHLLSAAAFRLQRCSSAGSILVFLCCCNRFTTPCPLRPHLAPHIIQWAKFTVAHLPCIHLDPSQRLLSLIDLHQIDQVSPYNWSSLFGTVIAYDDLRPLVITLALLLDKHKIVAHPSNFTKWTKEFICPTCSQFRLIFKCSKPHAHLASNHWLLKLQQPGHSAECPASTCVHHLSVLANLPALISHKVFGDTGWLSAN